MQKINLRIEHTRPWFYSLILQLSGKTEGFVGLSKKNKTKKLNEFCYVEWHQHELPARSRPLKLQFGPVTVINNSCKLKPFPMLSCFQMPLLSSLSDFSSPAELVFSLLCSLLLFFVCNTAHSSSLSSSSFEHTEGWETTLPAVCWIICCYQKENKELCYCEALILNCWSHLILLSIAPTSHSYFSFTPFCLFLSSPRLWQVSTFPSLIRYSGCSCKHLFHSVLGSFLASALLSSLLSHQFPFLIQDHLITLLATAFLRTSL